MCFSASASFAAGTGLLAVGAFTVRSVRRNSELPYAAIPLLFAVQQLIEGAIWLSFRSNWPLPNPPLTSAYSLFSHVLWPAYVPLAVLLLEPVQWRRSALFVFCAAGAAVGLYLLINMIRFPIVSREWGGHIEYVSPHFYALVVMGGYLAGTCVSALFSSYGTVRTFGVAALLSFLGAYAVYARWFISVWCFFAASLSVIVLLHFAGRFQPSKEAAHGVAV